MGKVKMHEYYDNQINLEGIMYYIHVNVDINLALY